MPSVRLHGLRPRTPHSDAVNDGMDIEVRNNGAEKTNDSCYIIWDINMQGPFLRLSILYNHLISLRKTNRIGISNQPLA